MTKKHSVNLLGNNAQSHMLLFPTNVSKSGCKELIRFGKILLQRYKAFATQDVQPPNTFVFHIF